jgi:hypothetical protein
VSGATADRIFANVSDATAGRLNLAVPIVEDLDKKVFAAIGDDGEKLNMVNWHCGTTHCRAGWAVTLAGDKGAKLEKAIGYELAGRFIYEASTGRPAPDFFASNKSALADIKSCAMAAA